MKPVNKLIIILTTLLCGLVWTLPAEAMPYFARKNGVQCSYCHTAWPQLNAKGRAFKEAGYRLPAEVGKDRSLLQLIKTFPIGAMVESNVEKKDTEDTKLHALGEYEMFVAGPVSRKLSFWAEIEGEGEDGLNSQVGTANVAYHFNSHLNVRLAYADIFWDDPYSFLSDHFRMGNARPSVIDQNFGGSEGEEGELRRQRQMVSAYGRFFDNKLFYDVVWAANAKDVDGADPRVAMGRLAFDITDDIHIGGFYIDGSKGSYTTDASVGIVGGVPAVVAATFTPRADFSRYGFDGHVDYRNFRLHGAYVHARDNLNDGTGDQANDAFSFEGFYTFKDKSGAPTWVPLIMYNNYETTNGTKNFGEGTIQLNYYLFDNVKVTAQYFKQLDTPAGDPKNDAITLQLHAAF